jgi:hypothetical protein
MFSVSIVGAGELGGAVARVSRRVNGLRGSGSSTMQDDCGGQALDIQQAGPIEGSDTRLTATLTS